MLRLTRAVVGKYLWQEFQGDGRVDWDVTTHTKSNKGSQHEDAIVIRRSSETQSKDGSNQHRQVEGILTA